jgi:hypothetical protein
MSKQKKAKKPIDPWKLPSWKRDALTGAPLEQGTLRYPLRCYDLSRPKPRRKDIPTKIHCRDVSEDGSPDWIAQFSRYMRDVMPESMVEIERNWRQWWNVSFAETLLYANFPEDAVDAIFWVHRDGFGYKEAAEYIGHTPHWLVRHECQMRRMIRDMIPKPSWETRHVAV